MSECPKSPSGKHSWIMTREGVEKCLWCGAIKPSEVAYGKEIVALKRKGLSFEQIGKELNLPTAYVEETLRKIESGGLHHSQGVPLEGFYDRILGYCKYDKDSFYLTNELYGGYNYKCEKGSGAAQYVSADEVLELAEKVKVPHVRLAGVAWKRIGREGMGEKVSVEEAKRLLMKLKGVESFKGVSEEIVSEMCDLLTVNSGACLVLEAALFSAKSTLPLGSPRRVFIQDLAAALNRRDLLRDKNVDRFCELGYKYMK